MTMESSKIIIDDNLVLDINTGVIGSPVPETSSSTQEFPTEDLMIQLDKLEEAISDLESSFDSNSVSRLSEPGREGIYHKAGLITNIVLGIIFALILIILLV